MNPIDTLRKAVLPKKAVVGVAVTGITLGSMGCGRYGAEINPNDHLIRKNPTYEFFRRDDGTITIVALPETSDNAEDEISRKCGKYQTITRKTDMGNTPVVVFKYDVKPQDPYCFNKLKKDLGDGKI